ncbi:MAG TPA: sigma-70 family RNA polymerase sigma factor [Bacteroidia bacterium]|nr:sigma-70 family RNA polymerase sigma factor [Bacteroidia bacterium]
MFLVIPMIEIVSKIKSKDNDAIALLYNRYGKKLYGYAIVKWKLNEDEAWELVYKTFYKVIQVIDEYKFENEDKFIGFVFKIYLNYLRNHYRDTKDKKLETVELTEIHELVIVDKNEKKNDQVKRSPLLECLQKVLQHMEDWQRIILLMRAQDYAYEEIAKYVDKPVEQLKVYHMRLKKSATDKTNECINKVKHEG